MSLLALALTLATSCGQQDPPKVPANSPPPPPAAQEGTPPSPDEARATLQAAATAWVTAQGFTEAPATAAGSGLFREMTDPPETDALLAGRSGTLVAAPVCVKGGPQTGAAVFRYVDPAHEGIGRVLELRPEASRFVHQDVRIEAWCGGDGEVDPVAEPPAAAP